jgi:hypothetical protein
VPGTYADNGVSEILMLDADRMLVLERAYATGTGNSLRLYEIDTRAASDVLAVDALAPGNHRPAAKTPGGRLRHAGPVPPRQHRGHVLGAAAARRQAHAGGRERRQFQPASSDPVRRFRIHRP